MFSILKMIRASFGHDRFSAETFDRLLWSHHVADLRWIAQVTVAIVTLMLMVIAIAMVAPAVVSHPGVASGDNKVSALDALRLLQVSAILAGVGAIIAWCYQSGSARLGAVDLFACEITTLCRICTINGLADTCVAAFEVDTSQTDREHVLEARERFSHFDSEETYTPIFDGNAKDLQILSVKVVTNITAFYAYWKATRDAFRRLAKTPQEKSGVPRKAEDDSEDDSKYDSWDRAMRNVIYMQFLAFESARKAVRDLIEFQPSLAENTITILISELPAYRFLLDHFPKSDVRYSRLELREEHYRSLVPKIYYEVSEKHSECLDADRTNRQLRRLAPEDLEELKKDWAKAHGMLNELKHRYEAAFGELPRREVVELSKVTLPAGSGQRSGLGAAHS